MKPMSETYKIPDLSHVNPAWAAEFRGLFLADGSALFSVYRHTRYKHIPLIKPILVVGLREDSKDTIFNIKEALGVGTIQYVETSKYAKARTSASNNSRNQWRWSASGTTTVYAVCTQILNNPFIPNRKWDIIKLIIEYCEVRFSYPHRLTELQRLELSSFVDKVQKSRLFHLDGQGISA